MCAGLPVTAQKRAHFCYLQCHLIDFILVLLAFLSLSLSLCASPLLSLCLSRSLSPPLPSPFPRQHVAIGLHNSRACGVFMHVCVHVSQAPGLGKSNTKHAAFRSYKPSGSCKCIIDSVNSDFTWGVRVCLCICVSVCVCARACTRTLSLHRCSLTNFH